jgi:hypothetical protein
MRLKFNAISACVAEECLYLLDSALNLYTLKNQEIVQSRSLLSAPRDKPIDFWRGALSRSARAIIIGAKTIRHFALGGSCAQLLEMTPFAPTLSAQQGDLIALMDDKGFLTIGSISTNKLISLCEEEILKPTALFFSSDLRYIFVANETKEAYIYDLQLHRINIIFELPTIVKKGSFLGNGDLILTTQSGDILIVSIYAKGAIKAHIKLPHKAHTSPLISKRYALFGLTSGEIVAIELEHFSICMRWQCLNESVVDLKMCGNIIIAIGAKNEVECYDLAKVSSDLRQLIAKEDYVAIYAQMKQNGFMLLIDSFNDFWEKAWKESVFPSAMSFLEEGLRDAAKTIAAPFLFDSRKRGKLNMIMGLAPHFKSLRDNVKANNYKVADELIGLYPILRESSSGKYYINCFESACEEAIKSLSSGSKEAADRALTYFKQAKETTINSIYAFAEEFAHFMALFNNGEWTQLFEWCERYPICKALPHYMRLMAKIDAIENELKENQEKHHYYAALQSIALLQEYAKTPKLDKNLIILLQFLDAIKNAHTELALSLVAQYPFLADSASFVGIHGEYKNIFERAKLAAQAGDSEVVRVLMAKLIKIEIFAEHIAFLQRIGFTEEMRRIRVGAGVDWSETLLLYTKYFGVDPLLMSAAIAQEVTDKIMPFTIGTKGYKQFGYPSSIVRFIDLGKEQKPLFIQKALIASMVFILISFVSLAALLQKTDRPAPQQLYEDTRQERSE